MTSSASSETLRGIEKWRWSSREQKPEKVICFPSGRRDYLYVPDEGDAMGGQLIYAGGLFNSERAVFEHAIEEQERYIKSSQDRIERLRGRMERASA